jgi:hypothetical protein
MRIKKSRKHSRLVHSPENQKQLAKLLISTSPKRESFSSNKQRTTLIILQNEEIKGAG